MPPITIKVFKFNSNLACNHKLIRKNSNYIAYLLFLSYQSHTAFSIKVKVFFFTKNVKIFLKFCSFALKKREDLTTSLFMQPPCGSNFIQNRGWIISHIYGLWLRKLVVRWTKQQNKPLRVKFSVVDIPNMMIEIRVRFNILGILYLKKQPCQYSFYIVIRNNSKQVPKMISLYILNNQNT